MPEVEADTIVVGRDEHTGAAVVDTSLVDAEVWMCLGHCGPDHVAVRVTIALLQLEPKLNAVTRHVHTRLPVGSERIAPRVQIGRGLQGRIAAFAHADTAWCSDIPDAG